jgi:hypothetical protein
VSGPTAGELATVVLVYATQALAGWLALAWLRPPRTPGRAWADPRRWSRTLLLGPALVALQMLVLHAAGWPFGLWVIVLPWWIVAALAWALCRARRGADGAGRPPSVSTAEAPPPAPPLSTPARLVLALALALFVLALVVGLWMPVTTGDAMNQFALNARVFETHGSLAPEALKALAIPGHVEYPPLVPLNEALLFLAGGPQRALVIKPFFALASLAWMLLVIECCFAFLPPGRATFLALVALLAPAATLAATDGYADLRLAASVLLLALAGRALWLQPGRRRLLLYALCAVACALTKLEGLAIGLAAAALLAALALRRRLPALETLLVLAVMLALVLAWPAYTRHHDLGRMALVDAEWRDRSASLASLARLPGVLGTMLLMLVDVGIIAPQFGLFWLVCLGLSLWSLRHPALRPAVAVVLLCGAAHLLLYATVLALTPADLEWHVTTAAPRLLLHVAPWALLAAALSRGGAASDVSRA